MLDINMLHLSNTFFEYWLHEGGEFPVHHIEVIFLCATTRLENNYSAET